MKLSEVRSFAEQEFAKSVDDGAYGAAVGAGAVGTGVAARRSLRRTAPAVTRAAVRRLNSMPKERDSIEMGVRYSRNVMGTYRQKGRGYKKVSPTLKDMRAERQAATWWSSKQKHVNALREGKQPHVIGRKRYAVMRQMIDNAEPTNRALHRGLSDTAARYHRGARLSVPESSWTESKPLAEQYTRRGAGSDKVVLHLTGARATHIAPVTRYRNAEWVTPKADYDVTHTRRRDGVKHVYVRQRNA